MWLRYVDNTFMVNDKSRTDFFYKSSDRLSSRESEMTYLNKQYGVKQLGKSGKKQKQKQKQGDVFK